jgi:hypothetical protein
MDSILFTISRLEEANMKGSETPVEYGGGDGSSYEESITISGLDNLSAITAEYDYIERIWGVRGQDWNILKQQLHKFHGRYFDKLVSKLAGGLERYVFFDITAYFKAEKTRRQTISRISSKPR